MRAARLFSPRWRSKRRARNFPRKFPENPPLSSDVSRIETSRALSAAVRIGLSAGAERAQTMCATKTLRAYEATPIAIVTGGGFRCRISASSSSSSSSPSSSSQLLFCSKARRRNDAPRRPQTASQKLTGGADSKHNWAPPRPTPAANSLCPLWRRPSGSEGSQADARRCLLGRDLTSGATIIESSRHRAEIRGHMLLARRKTPEERPESLAKERVL